MREARAARGGEHAVGLAEKSVRIDEKVIRSCFY